MPADTTFSECGKAIPDYGYNDTAKDALIASWFKNTDARLQVALLSAILKQMETLTNAVNRITTAVDRLPASMARADRKEEIALEREKQKTAKAQRKTIETTPPTISLIHMTNEEIQAAVGNRRTLRKF